MFVKEKSKRKSDKNSRPGGHVVKPTWSHNKFDFLIRVYILRV